MPLIGVRCPHCSSRSFYAVPKRNIKKLVLVEGGQEEREVMCYRCKRCGRYYYEDETPRWKILHAPRKTKLERKAMLEQMFGKPKSGEEEKDANIIPGTAM